MDAVHLSLVWLLEGTNWPPHGWPSCDRLYFSYYTLLTMWLMVVIPWRGYWLISAIVPGPVGISLLYKILQLPSSYEFLYLLLQVSAVLCVMAVIFMKSTVFPLVTDIGWWVQWP